MKTSTLAFFLSFFIIHVNFAQTVSTLVDDFPGNDGLSMGPNGDIYVNCHGTGGPLNGTTVYKVTPSGIVTLFADSLSVFPVGSVFDQNENLLVTGHPSGNISRISPAGDTINIISTGISGAGSLEVDPNGNIYVSEFYMNRVLKFDSLGNNQSIYATGAPIVRPAGLTYVESTGNMYVGNWVNGGISQITPAGVITTFATLPVPNVGPIMNYGGYLFASSPQYHQIFVVNLQTQVVSLFAGTGVLGHNDGPLGSATFDTPTGIGTTDGQTFYVSESYQGSGRLRVIENVSLSMNEFDDEGAFKVYPNPCLDKLMIESTKSQEDNLQAVVYNLDGKIILQASSESNESGALQFEVAKLNPGMYLVKLIGDYGYKSAAYPFIKQ